MKPLQTIERPVLVDNRIWICYVEVFKTRKHIYIKPKGYEFFTFDFILKGKEYHQDWRYHTCKVIKGM